MCQDDMGMRPETKGALLHWLDVIQNNLMVGIAASFVFEQPDTWDLMNGAYVGFHPPGTEAVDENLSYKLPIHPVGEGLRDETLRKGLLSDFRNMLFRTVLAETMEHVSEYCRGTNQTERLLKSSWYNFARLIRNAETHDGVLRFDKKAPPPVTFQRWCLEAADEGKQLKELIGIPNTTSIPIIESARAFVQDEVS